MEALRNILETPLLRHTHARKRADIKVRFPELTKCPHDHFLSIHKYIKRSPQRFYSHSVYNKSTLLILGLLKLFLPHFAALLPISRVLIVAREQTALIYGQSFRN